MREESVDMAKCEHHEDYVRLHDSLKEHIGRVEKTLENRIEDTDHKLSKAFDRIDEVRQDLSNQGSDYRETATYVKTLYGRFDELTTQMQSIVNKLDQYIATMAIVQKDTDNNSQFSQGGRKLVFEIIKYIVIAAVGYAMASGGTP